MSLIVLGVSHRTAPVKVREQVAYSPEQAIEVLSERERAVFILCELEELGTRETAKILGITAITVRRHLGRARERLRRCLSDTFSK